MIILLHPLRIRKLNALAQRMAVRAPIDETAAAQRNALDAGGKVRAFYSVKGGSGKTVISAMVAQSLQLQFGKRVMLIDFNAQFGGLEVILGLESPRVVFGFTARFADCRLTTSRMSRSKKRRREFTSSSAR